MGELNQKAGLRARSPAAFWAAGGRTRQLALPALLGLAVTAVLVAVSDRYGYHRDEFYYLASGLHPAFGYVDQPPLTPLIARAEYELFGDSVVALRLAPALATGLTVLVTALIAGAGASRSATTESPKSSSSARATSGVNGGWST